MIRSEPFKYSAAWRPYAGVPAKRTAAGLPERGSTPRGRGAGLTAAELWVQVRDDQRVIRLKVLLLLAILLVAAVLEVPGL